MVKKQDTQSEIYSQLYSSLSRVIITRLFQLRNQAWPFPKNSNHLTSMHLGTTTLNHVVNSSPVKLDSISTEFNAQNLSRLGEMKAIIRNLVSPTSQKKAIVIPVQKPEKDPKYPLNHGSISLLPILDKILKQIILARIEKTIAEKNLLPDFQFGFRKRHSTGHQVYRVYNDIKKSFTECKSTGLVSLDI